MLLISHITATVYISTRQTSSEISLLSSQDKISKQANQTKSNQAYQLIYYIEASTLKYRCVYAISELMNKQRLSSPNGANACLRLYATVPMTHIICSSNEALAGYPAYHPHNQMHDKQQTTHQHGKTYTSHLFYICITRYPTPHRHIVLPYY